MATSIIEICNSALQGLKRERIMALTDNSEEANLCNQIWPGVRDMVLACHPWNSAMTLAQLQQSATAPAWKWDFAYPLPADCLRVFEVVGIDQMAVADWEIQGRDILCDEDAPVYISYARREEDPQKYDPGLCEVLIAALQARLAYPLTASVTAQQAAETLYQNRLRDARGIDARQGSAVKPIVESTWLRAKLGSRNIG